MKPRKRSVAGSYRPSDVLKDYWLFFLMILLSLAFGAFLAWVLVLMHVERSGDARIAQTYGDLRLEVTQGRLDIEEFLEGGHGVSDAQATEHLTRALNMSRVASDRLRHARNIVRPGLSGQFLAVLDRFDTNLSRLDSLAAVSVKSTPASDDTVLVDAAAFDRTYLAVMKDADFIRSRLEARVDNDHLQQRDIIAGLIALWCLLVLLGLAATRRRITQSRHDAEVLRQSEARFRELAELLPIGVFETDLHGIIRYANEDLASRCGLDNAAIARQVNLLSIIAPDERDHVRKWFSDLAAREVIDAEEHRLVDRDGSIFTALVNVGPIVTGKRVSGLRGIVANIADRKEAEEALRREKTKYQTLMRVAPVGIFRLDENSACTYINERGAKLLGATVVELLGNAWLACIHPDDRKATSLTIQEAITKGIAGSLETRCRHADGTTAWVIMSIEPEHDESGVIINYVGSIVNVTERKQAARDLMESEERFKHLSEAAAEGIVIHEDGIVLDANRALAELLGISVDKLVGLNVFDFIMPEYHELIRRRIADGYTRPIEIVARASDGSLHPVEIIGSDMPYKGRTVRVAAVRDISERRRAREEISKFKTINDTADYGSTITDLSGTIIYVNSHFARMHGYEPEELMGKNLDMCFDLDREPDYNQRVEALKETGRLATREIWHKRRDGSAFPTLQSATVVYGHDGKPLYIGSTSVDISEMKQAERKLQELAAIPENNPNLVLTIDAEGNVLYLNPAARQLLESHGEPTTGIWSWLPDDARATIGGCALSGKSVVDIHHEFRQTAWSWAFHPVPGQPIVHCSGRDVTQGRLQQHELRRLSAAVEQSASIIVITDPDGCIEYVNPQFTAATGYTSEDAVGQRMSLLRSGEHGRAFYKDLWKTIKAGKIWTGRVRNRRQDGTHYWERKTISAVLDAGGKIINYVSVGDDITLEMQTQQKLVESDKMSAIGMLAAGVAHEFKNYLGGIIGNASFALDELDTDKGLELARETLHQIIEVGDKANDVAMSLLSYSKARPDDFTLEDLSLIVTRSINLVEKEMKNLSIDIVTYFENAPEIEVSASKIQQLLLNLLINAQHAIREDGVITISLSAFEDRLQIRVADSGVGISESTLGRIFDPFYSTKGVWGKDELVGTGMGLSICRNIAREHNGDLTVDSVQGIGTTFTLTLPLHRENAFTSLPGPITEDRPLRLLIFALQKSILTTYFPAACERGAKLLWVDAVDQIGSELDRLADLVVCDAKFIGKVELLRMVELCQAAAVPFVLVNCGVMEYQLEELYDMSRANFKEVPDFNRLLRLGLNEPDEAPADAGGEDLVSL